MFVYIGTKSEMVQLEKEYIEGKYTPFEEAGKFNVIIVYRHLLLCIFNTLAGCSTSTIGTDVNGKDTYVNGKDTDVDGKDTDVDGKDTDVDAKDINVDGKDTDVNGKDADVRYSSNAT